MRPEKWWVGLSLAAALIGGAMLSDLPVVTVTINRSADEARIATTTNGMPFVGLKESVWCAAGGACWQRVRDGLQVTEVEGSVYGDIGLQNGDILVAYDRSTVKTFTSLFTASQALERDRAICLQVYRGQETIEFGILLPEDENANDTSTETETITDPCTEKTQSRRSIRRARRSGK